MERLERTIVIGKDTELPVVQRWEPFLLSGSAVICDVGSRITGISTLKMYSRGFRDAAILTSRLVKLKKLIEADQINNAKIVIKTPDPTKYHSTDPYIDLTLFLLRSKNGTRQ